MLQVVATEPESTPHHTHTTPLVPSESQLEARLERQLMAWVERMGDLEGPERKRDERSP